MYSHVYIAEILLKIYCLLSVLIDKNLSYVKMQLEDSCSERALYMSKFDKAKERLSSCPKDYTYSEAKYLLSQLRFEEFTKGKTSGSRVKFYRADDQRIILLHKPHPGDIMSIGAVKDLAVRLMEMGEL